MPMLLGVSFPMHRGLDMVYCTSPIEFQISRHIFAAMVLFTPPTREQRYLLLAHLTVYARWYRTPTICRWNWRLCTWTGNVR
jgi:hypothetical protein